MTNESNDFPPSVLVCFSTLNLKSPKPEKLSEKLSAKFFLPEAASTVAFVAAPKDLNAIRTRKKNNQMQRKDFLFQKYSE